MLQAIPRLVAEGVVCDACVTDPPYGLSFMGVAWDTMPANRGRPNIVRDPNVKWDGAVAFRPETWATVATILRPGAFLVAFGGTRTYHHLACAIEDGGFVIQDCIMWLFATGFPKRRDMLKPAYEPIVLAYKPGGKRTMQIDECRIELDGLSPSVTRRKAAAKSGNYGRLGDKTNGEHGRLRANGNREEGLAHYLAGKESEQLGRWPANVVHDGSDEVLAAFPDSAGQLRSVGPANGPKPSINVYGDYGPRGQFDPRGDSGSAARFFFQAKADKADRWGSRHPTVKPVELMKWLVKLVTPAEVDGRPGLVLDPFAGSGTTGVAALATGRDAILIERDDAYVADIRERMAHYEGAGRHSLASKARRVQNKPIGGLFTQSEYDEAADARGSYDEAVRAIGERVKAGAPVPDFFRSDKPK